MPHSYTTSRDMTNGSWNARTAPCGGVLLRRHLPVVRHDDLLAQRKPDERTGYPGGVLAELPKISRLAEWQWKSLLIHVSVNRWERKPADIVGAARIEEL